MRIGSKTDGSQYFSGGLKDFRIYRGGFYYQSDISYLTNCLYCLGAANRYVRGSSSSSIFAKNDTLTCLYCSGTISIQINSSTLIATCGASTCDLTCLTCSGSTSTNCLSCSNGFLYQNTCITTCPASYYGNIHTCMACDSTCLTCIWSAIQCTSCNTNNSFFLNQKDSICINCSDNCTTCANIETNCLSCPITTNGISFYLDTNQTDQFSKYCRPNITNESTASPNQTLATTVIACVTIGVAIGAIPLNFMGGLGALWGILDILQMLYYYIFLNMNVPQNFIDFLLLFKFSLLLLPNLGLEILESLALKYNMAIPEESTNKKFEDQNLNALF